MIDIFINVCAYMSFGRKIMEAAHASLEHHVESISNQYQMAYHI